MVKGEIRIADRAYLQPDRIALVLEQGADGLIRAGWRNARWLDAEGKRVDLLAEFREASDCGLIDRPISLDARAASRSPCGSSPSRSPGKPPRPRGGRRVDGAKAGPWNFQGNARRRGLGDPGDLACARGLPAADILALYRLRWRIELGFKRLKSLIGLKGPPGADERSARPYVLAHLIPATRAAGRRTRGLRPLGREPTRGRLDPGEDLAPVAPARRFPAASNHARADLRLPAKPLGGSVPPSARASAKTTHVPMHAPDMLAPMGL